MVLLIDNYDSFTYNIFQEISELGAEVRVIRNDRITIDEVLRLSPERVVVSPGPGRPENAGISVSLIKELAGKIPVLGVCLGHQALGYAYGGKIVGAKRLMHGKTSLIFHDGSGIFAGIPNPFEATRYHSLLVEKETFLIGWLYDKNACWGGNATVHFQQVIVTLYKFFWYLLLLLAGFFIVIIEL